MGGSARRRQRAELRDLLVGELVGQRTRGGAAQPAAAQQVLQRVAQRIDRVAEAIDHLERDARRPRRQLLVLEHRHRRLEVVEDGHEPLAVAIEARGRGAAIEVDEDARHRLARRQRLGERDRALRVVLVGAGALQDLLEQAAVDAAGDDVAVERVDEGVGLGVVAEAGLAGLGGRPARPASSAGSL